MEIEAKFEVSDPDLLLRLEQAQSLAGFELGVKRRIRVVDTYFDTRARSLFAAGYYLRLRRHGDDEALITLKQFAGEGLPIYRRAEHEITLPCKRRAALPVEVGKWPDGPARREVERLIGGKDLSPLFKLRQDRTVRPILDDGQTIAEMSLDTVRVKHGDGITTFTVIEVELNAGREEADLETIVAALQDEPGLTPGATSKFERALTLIDHAASASRDHAAPAHGHADETEALGRGLHLDDTMAEAARKTIVHQLHQIRHREEGARSGVDPEELHDMRVATRRARAAFDLFATSLNSGYRPFLRPLKRLGRALGRVRDLDVFRQHADEYLAGLPSEQRLELAPFLAALEAERASARRALLAHLDGREYRRFKRDFGIFLEAPTSETARPGSGGPVPERVRHVLPAMLLDAYARVRAFDERLGGGKVALEEYHELRIVSKRLRYALEFFQEILPTDAETLINRTKALQDHLGAMQDEVLACGIVRDFLGSPAWGAAPRGPGRSLPPGEGPGLAAYLTSRLRRLDEMVATFPKIWTHMVGTEVGQSFGAITAALVE